MTNIVYIATSLDGHIARKDGSIDWLMEVPNPDGSDFGFNEFMQRVDGIIMGRNTFETVVGFGEWPYSKPVFVLSNTMKSLPDGYQDKGELVNGELKDILTSLETKGIKKLYVDGGKTIQSFLQEDLIDEMIITRIPIILGSGIPLFNDMDLKLKFKVVNAEVLNQDMIKSTYLRVRDI